MPSDGALSVGEDSVAALHVIRVETALSRFPIHRLAKKGEVEIEIREESDDGVFIWQVSHNSKHGQPGPLAYKVDTLVVNRRLEHAGRDVPRVLRLGSLGEIARAIGAGGKNTGDIKEALLQNAGAFIEAKVRYKAAGGKGSRYFEFAASRYGVVFTGEQLPSGREADAVYIVLHDLYRELLRHAEVRPLDYDLLKGLPPGTQRLYELLSFRMFAALKQGLPTARLDYGDFCRHAPQTRHLNRDDARRQMNKLHLALRKVGYIADVKLETVIDPSGLFDLRLHYTPGPKALVGHEAFAGKASVRTSPAPPPIAVAALPAPVEAENPLVGELVHRGVTRAKAEKLVMTHALEMIAEKIEVFDWLVEKKGEAAKKNPSGYLVKSIEDRYAPSPGWVSRLERARKAEEERTRKDREVEAREAEARKKAEEDRNVARWAAIPAQQKQAYLAKAREGADQSDLPRHPRLLRVYLERQAMELLARDLAIAPA